MPYVFLEEKMTFIEKRGCGFGVLTVEPPSPAAQRCTNGAPDGADGAVTEVADLDGSAAEKFGDLVGGARLKLGASCWFCLHAF